MNLLEQLKTFTEVVADTGDFESIRQYKPVDATTNPSLIFAAAQNTSYFSLIEDAIAYGRKMGGDAAGQLDHTLDKQQLILGLRRLK